MPFLTVRDVNVQHRTVPLLYWANPDPFLVRWQNVCQAIVTRESEAGWVAGGVSGGSVQQAEELVEAETGLADQGTKRSALYRIAVGH